MTGDLRRAKKMLEGPRGGGEHVGHCFDYLRQSLMCAGDMSVEWPRVESDGRKIAVDGWGVEHRCRRWVSCFLKGFSVSCEIAVLTLRIKGCDYGVYGHSAFQ